MTKANPDTLVIGSGPAGLAAAEAAAEAGAKVLLVDQKPSFGRKFLMAGKSGLNLTKDEPAERFRNTITAAEPVAEAVRVFGPREVMAWAEGLGQRVFTGSSGRVFPEAMKASPLLRAWLARLDRNGVEFQTRWRWIGWQDECLRFETPEGIKAVHPRATVLALGGGSWAKLGSDGMWTQHLRDVPLKPFAPSNIGFRVDWSDHMRRFAGSPVKPVALTAGTARVVGEFVVTPTGIEGSAVYAITPALLAGSALTLDLFPDLGPERIATRLARPRKRNSLANHLRKTLGLTGVKASLLREAGPPPDGAAALAARVKAVPVGVIGPNDVDQAISTSGGVAMAALTPDLMLRDRPGVFCAGEMLDWDAPTGGYLITTCLATGRVAGQAAARFALT